ncbi:MAG: hypothetical protein A2V70_16990 [Planctomycetes bacterium RBG_13_63_9]|nr:MAG: hypothetical protein A2V70_16990 [Planctomycetes bacterium RBG_13_63_9]
MAFGLSGLLAVAAIVEPDARGLGTHQRFGFPPCTFRVLFGRPCPSCGMTTSWAHLVRGQPVRAAECNAGGSLLGLLAVVSTPWLLISAARGRWLGWTPNSTVVAWVAVGVVLVTLIGWAIRLVIG